MAGRRGPRQPGGVDAGCRHGRPKYAKLRAERGIGFEDVAFHIERGDLLDVLEHPNHGRYAGQRIFVVRREDYVYLVPFPRSPASSTRGLRRGHAVALRAEADVEDEHTVFLKTINQSERHEAVPRGGVQR